jgi:hypothetical protein
MMGRPCPPSLYARSCRGNRPSEDFSTRQLVPGEASKTWLKAVERSNVFQGEISKGPNACPGLTELSSGSALSHAGSAANGNFR